MKEFYEYDTLLANRTTNTPNYFSPLLSWEFYGEDLMLLGSHRDDLNTLKKLTKNWSFSRNYYTELVRKQSVIVITDPNLTITYASSNMKKMNGYSNNEVIGNSPKMFQGEDTCREMSGMIRIAVKNQLPFEASILNYRKDDSSYMCYIKGFPVHNKHGKLINYIAFEKAV